MKFTKVVKAEDSITKSEQVETIINGAITILREISNSFAYDKDNISDEDLKAIKDLKEYINQQRYKIISYYKNK